MSHGPLGPAAFWEGYEQELTTLAIYSVGIAIFALLVGMFYLSLSRRNLFSHVGAGRGRAEFLVLLPLVSFGFFLVLSVALFFLAKPLQGLSEADRARQILLLSMAVVAGVRVTAYVSERAAEDLAKLVPLGLLGVLLVDPGYLTLEAPFERLAALPSLLGLVARYFLVFVILEAVLRVAWIASGGRGRARRQAPPQPRSPPRPSPPSPQPPRQGEGR